MPLIDSIKLYKGNQRAGFTVQPLGIKASPSEDSLAVTYGKRKNGSYVIPKLTPQLLFMKLCHTLGA